MWIIELKFKSKWHPLENWYPTRQKAREKIKTFEGTGLTYRAVKYERVK